MIFERFLQWMGTAPAHERAEAAGALGRAYRHASMDDPELRLAEVTMTALLDDPFMPVRRSLAEAIAAAPRTPRHIVLALANDCVDVAGPVLALSPVLTDADLVDLAAGRESSAQTAIAARAPVSAPVAAALAEVGSAEACAMLIRNQDTVLTPSTLARLVERFGVDGEVRDCLLARTELPIGLRQSLVRASTETEASRAMGRDLITPAQARVAIGDACEKATVTLARERAAGEDLACLVRHLRDTGQLTPALLLRAIAEGSFSLFETALAELSGLPRERVTALIHDRQGAGSDALYRRAGLPAATHAAFRAAADALKDATGATPSRRMLIERMVTAYAETRPPQFDAVMALLQTMAVEAARDEARSIAGGMAMPLRLVAA
jgi:uncharacterized protein (DUF2336 family)